MSISDRWHLAKHSVLRLAGRRGRRPKLDTFVMPEQERAAEARQPSGELARIFYGHDGRLIHKWTHYFEVYERHLAAYRNTGVRMLEIGVSKGGSLEMWRRYLGERAVIFGIDIDPACAGRVDPPNQVRIGSQADPVFLARVLDEMGGVDIVLDDGSHVSTHQRVSFEVLFPRLVEGGLYMIEDMHTAYWPSYEGGHRRRGTAIELVKNMIDDMHGWYHEVPGPTPARDAIGAIHVYDSITVIEKRQRGRPVHTTSKG